MEGDQLRQRLAAMRQAMFDEEMLDEFFDQLENLDDDDTPNFAEDFITNIYYKESSRMIAEIEQEMEENPMVFEKFEETLNQLRTSSAYIGARKVRAAALQTKESIIAGNMECAKASLDEVKREREALKARLEPYLELRKRVGKPKKDGAPSSSKDGEEK